MIEIYEWRGSFPSTLVALTWVGIYGIKDGNLSILSQKGEGNE